MNEVADIKLCKELYELSGWCKTQMLWHKSANPMRALSTWLPITTEAYWNFVRENKPDDEILTIPGYSLGYLLRKLPENITIAVIKDVVHHNEKGKKFITNRYSAHNLGDVKSYWSDTPEDALCKLAIELFKQGILTKGTI